MNGLKKKTVGLSICLVIIAVWCVINGVSPFDECFAYEEPVQNSESTEEELKNSRYGQVKKVAKAVLISAAVACLTFYVVWHIGSYFGGSGGGVAGGTAETVVQTAAQPIAETVVQTAAQPIAETVVQSSAIPPDMPNPVFGLSGDSATARNAARFVAFNKFISEHGRIPKMSELGLGEFEKD